MRTKTQELSVFAEDLNAFALSQTKADGSPFENILITGTGKGIVTDVNGVKSIDLGRASIGAFFIPLINFETGATGSTANVTITGEGFDGAVMTESVLLPGASGNVQATKLFRKVTSFATDADFTNVEVGVKAEIDQFSPWLVFDPYANPFSVFLDLARPTSGSTLTIELTTDPAIWVSPIDPNAITVFNAVAPFAAGATIAAQGALQSDVDIALPFLAARLRHTAGTAGKWRARFTQSGGGFGR